jgi:hypothetical protein
MENHGGMILTGKTEEIGEKPVPVPYCLYQKSTWTDLGTNPGLCCERPMTNHLCHGTAYFNLAFCFLFFVYVTDV